MGRIPDNDCASSIPVGKGVHILELPHLHLRGDTENRQFRKPVKDTRCVPENLAYRFVVIAEYLDHFPSVTICKPGLQDTSFLLPCRKEARDVHILIIPDGVCCNHAITPIPCL